MEGSNASELRMDLLRRSHIFAAALRKVFQEEVLEDVAGQTLSFQHLKLLFLVARKEGQTIGDAAAFLGVSNAAASKAVEKLVRRRLLKRSETLGDRRSSQLSLTENSRRLLEKYTEARNQKAADIFHEFSIEDLETVSSLLDRLASAIVSHCAGQKELCLQCSIYASENFKPGEIDQRICLYQRQKTEKQDRPDVHPPALHSS